MPHEIPPQDFILPLSAALAGREILEDWYRMHHRLGAVLGDRTRDDETRYIFADEPTHSRRGEAVRIRTTRPEVANCLAAKGLPELYPADLLHEGELTFALSVSIRQTRMSTSRLAGEVVSRLIQGAGLRGVRLTPHDLQREGYRIRKTRGDGFVIPGATVRFRARIAEPDRLIRAMREGIGRDRGFGFGLLTPFQEDVQ